MKGGPGDFPVGLTVSMSDWWTPEGGEAGMERARAMHEDFYLEATRGNDFIGVQAYTRTRIGLDGLPMDPDPGRPDRRVDGLRVLAAVARSLDPARDRRDRHARCT